MKFRPNGVFSKLHATSASAPLRKRAHGSTTERVLRDVFVINGYSKPASEQVRRLFWSLAKDIVNFDEFEKMFF